MDLAFVDKLAIQNTEVKYLLVTLMFFRDFLEFKQEKQNIPKTLRKLSRINFNQENNPEKI